MNNLSNKKLIITNPRTQIKWMCYDILITYDKQVVNLSLEHIKERLVGGSYGYTVNGIFRTKK